MVWAGYCLKLLQDLLSCDLSDVVAEVLEELLDSLVATLLSTRRIHIDGPQLLLKPCSLDELFEPEEVDLLGGHVYFGQFEVGLEAARKRTCIRQGGVVFIVDKVHVVAIDGVDALAILNLYHVVVHEVIDGISRL